jgi:hypothetical protein
LDQLTCSTNAKPVREQRLKRRRIETWGRFIESVFVYFEWSIYWTKLFGILNTKVLFKQQNKKPAYVSYILRKFEITLACIVSGNWFNFSATKQTHWSLSKHNHFCCYFHYLVGDKTFYRKLVFWAVRDNSVCLLRTNYNIFHC